jgi:uncharacterized protein YqjF (DUF2071 family)
MTDGNIFLTAEWNNLAMLNYAVDPSLLRRYVPDGTELDDVQGITYVSLIGFQFNRTRVRGVAIPFHQDFEEVNLRFYVRRGSKKGVVFIRELVPRFAIAAVARLAFNENYSCVPMAHRIKGREDGKTAAAEYSWGSKANRCALTIETDGPRFLPAEGSLSQFITEHYWGYAAQRGGGWFNIRDGPSGKRAMPASPETHLCSMAQTSRPFSASSQTPPFLPRARP